MIINKVRYENTAPWPSGANASGYSLQLIDALQDNARVSNWSDGSGWRFYSLTGNIGAFSNLLGTNLTIFVQLAGEAYVDDISLVPLSGPSAGMNIITNGVFEAPGPLSNTWIVPATMPGTGRIRRTGAGRSWSNSCGPRGAGVHNTKRPVLALNDRRRAGLWGCWCTGRTRRSAGGRSCAG